MEWEAPDEKQENIEAKVFCKKCGNDTFHVYIKVIIDDAQLYCANCGEFFI